MTGPKRTGEEELQIMRGSWIGTFGAAALVLSFPLRCSTLAGIGEMAGRAWSRSG
jgi:cobalamin synthase